MKENKTLLFLLVLSIFAFSILYLPFAIWKAYLILAAKYGWLVVGYWEVFGLLTFKSLLFLGNDRTTNAIWSKVKGERSPSDLVTDALSAPLAVSAGWFIIYLTI